MLDQSDLQQIKELFEEGFEDAVIRLIKPSFDNFEIRLGGLESKVGGLESKVGSLESKVGSLESKVNQMKGDMVTIDYFDRSLADLRGDSIARERKIDEKTNIATDSLKRNNLLTKQEEEKVSSLQVFPSLSGLRQELHPNA